jgi:hypothetical protein
MLITGIGKAAFLAMTKKAACQQTTPLRVIERAKLSGFKRAVPRS